MISTCSLPRGVNECQSGVHDFGSGILENMIANSLKTVINQALAAII